MQAIILFAGMGRRIGAHCRLKFVFATLLSFVTGISYAYDFDATCTTGQTLYYNIIDSVNYKVCVTHPGPDIDHAYLNYAKPTGDLVIPDEVNHNGHLYHVTEIGSCAFVKCTGLDGVLEIPYSITRIGSYAFLHCNNISVLFFNCQQCNEAFAAFEGCSFDTILLGDSVTVIPDGIFSNSMGITSVQIPVSVRTIGERAFYNCPNLENIDIGDSVIIIEDYAFSDCPSLETLNTINANSIGDYSFFNAPLLQSINVGDDVLCIGDFSFFGSRGSRTLTLGRVLHEVGDYAFYMTNSIDTVFCSASSPPLLGEGAFGQLFPGSCLVVNCDALDLYQSVQGWDVFLNIIADHTYSLEVVADHAEYGYVTGFGDGFCYGDTVSVEAIPLEGYIFKEWNDGDTNNPRDIIIQSDTLVIARFVALPPTEGVDNTCFESINVVSSGRSIIVSVSSPTIIQVFDVVGKCLYRSETKEEKINLVVPNGGVYVIVTEDNQIKKIVIGG